MVSQAKFYPGQIVDHSRFGYRGVVVDVDPVFSMSDEWYEQVARSRPPKDKPWYHVLVDNAEHTTYVAERHLNPAADLTSVTHPQLNRYFSLYEDGKYIPLRVAM